MPGSLCEREDAVTALTGSLDRAASGNGNALFLVGSAGLGKTSLLSLASRLADPQFSIAYGRGERMEAVIPFGVAEQLFPGSLREEGFAVEPSAPYLRLLSRIESDSQTPLLLLIDDLHWADPDSLSLIAFLARRIETRPISIIAALRPWPAQAYEVALGLARNGARVEELAPLSRDGTAELLSSDAAASLSPAMIDRTWQLTGGNPLLIGLAIEQVRHGGSLPEPDLLPTDTYGDVAGLEPGEPERDPGGPDGHDGDGRSQIAQSLLLSRFSGLDDNGLKLVRYAAVAGVSFRPEVVIEAAGLSLAAAELVLEALFHNGLIVDDEPGEVRFAHPLFEQVQYQRLAPPVRRQMHARIFELLVKRGLEREAAEHAIRGEMIGDSAAAGVLERTGATALAAGAVATAARNFAWAVKARAERCPPGLLLRCAQAQIASGQAEEAAANVERLLEAEPDLDWQDRVEALRTLGQASYLAGASDLGDRQMSAAVAVAESNDPVAAVRPLLDQTTIAWMSEGPVGALPLAAKARRLATDADPELRVAADALWGHLAVESGDQAGHLAVEPVGQRIASGDTEHLLSPGELVWPAAAVYGYAHTAKYGERLDESLAALELARQALVEAGAARGIATVTLFIGNQLVRRGRLDEAMVEADRAEEYTEWTPLARPFAQLIRAEALAWKGRFTESLAAIDAADAATPPPGLWAVSLWGGLVRGMCLLWQGQAAASDQFLELERQAAQVALVEPSSQPWAAFAVAAHLAAGRRDDAARVTELTERLAARMKTRWPTAVAGLNRGRLLEFDDLPDQADAAYRKALQTVGGSDLPLLRVMLLLALGRSIRRQGRSLDSRRPLAEAIQLAEALEADFVAETAAAELRLAGGRRRRRASQRDALTPAERRVAIEVAAGYTNAEVARRLHLSVNTVSTHLKRIYLKLGINSRKQLTDLGIGS